MVGPLLRALRSGVIIPRHCGPCFSLLVSELWGHRGDLLCFWCLLLRMWRWRPALTHDRTWLHFLLDPEKQPAPPYPQ